jgi:hypothetical protein
MCPTAMRRGGNGGAAGSDPQVPRAAEHSVHVGQLRADREDDCSESPSHSLYLLTAAGIAAMREARLAREARGMRCPAKARM